MAATKLSSQDKKDLDKFTKYFIYKCIQIIVQSRLGEKKKTTSKPFSSGSDWFNLAIKDLPEVLAETKKIYSSSSLIYKTNINVETSLKTSEGESMTLEVWSLSMSTEQNDPCARILYQVYNRMSLLLKSLLSVSRITPAYKLSRNQGPETYVVCYRIYLGERATGTLVNGASSRRIGMVPTPLGSISLDLAYRTKIIFSPHQSTLSMDLKDDHFTSDEVTSYPCKVNNRRSSQCMTPEDAEPCPAFSSSPATSPLRNSSPGRRSDSPVRRIKSSGEIPVENKTSLSKGLKMGAFVSSTITEQPKADDDIPFSTLLNRATDANANAKQQVTIMTEPSSGKVTVLTESSTEDVDNASGRRRHASADQPADFVMVELKTPFAGREGAAELGQFYRECQGAPPLSDGPGDTQHLINSITEQISQFEANVNDFDDFIDTLLTED